MGLFKSYSGPIGSSRFDKPNPSQGCGDPEPADTILMENPGLGLPVAF